MKADPKTPDPDEAAYWARVKADVQRVVDDPDAEPYEVIWTVAKEGCESREHQLQILRYSRSMKACFLGNPDGFADIRDAGDFIDQVTFYGYRGDLADTLVRFVVDETLSTFDPLG